MSANVQVVRSLCDSRLRFFSALSIQTIVCPNKKYDDCGYVTARRSGTALPPKKFDALERHRQFSKSPTGPAGNCFSICCATQQTLFTIAAVFL
jgi:hypothetical protein